MKASELIQQLQEAIADSGDRPVKYEDDGRRENVDRIIADVVDGELIFWIM